MDETSHEAKNDEAPAGRPVIGVIIIVLVVLLGGFYFWKTKVETSIQQSTPTIPRE